MLGDTKRSEEYQIGKGKSSEQTGVAEAVSLISVDRQFHYRDSAT